MSRQAEVDEAGVPYRECDVVMRGGVTSGVVYPGALAVLAERFRFRSIGGTSAGAIAAAILAAVEYGRRSRRNCRSVEILAAAPDDIAGDSAKNRPGIDRLFQPVPRLKPVFDLLLGSLARTSAKAAENRSWSIALAAAGRAIAAFPHWALVGGLVGLSGLLALLSLAPLRAFDWQHIALAAVLLVLVVIGAGIAASVVAARRIAAEIPRAHFGLCSGLTQGDRRRASLPRDPAYIPHFPPPRTLALTDWMHWTIQAAAQLPYGHPLTFGKLWEADGKKAEQPGYRAIDLALITTNLSHGVQHCFPDLERDGFRFFFRLEDMAELMPAEVVGWMKDKSKAASRFTRTLSFPCCKVELSKIVERLIRRGYLPLPDAEDLPILLGARMSLSFPFLLRQTRLYEIDFAALNSPHLTDYDLEKVMRPVWFTDGGVTSNFPIHVFDGPVPSRPTFGINLVYGKPTNVAAYQLRDAESEPDEETEEAGPEPRGLRTEPSASGDSRVFLVNDNSSGQAPSYRTVADPEASGFGQIRQFGGSLVDTARNWGDTEMMTQPAYRDRVAHVMLENGEGGFNLRMEGALVRALSGHGAAAGTALIERFVDTAPGEGVKLDWQNHCWIRYRSLMATLERLLLGLGENWRRTGADCGLPPADGEPLLYDELIRRKLGKGAGSYKWATRRQQAYASAVTGAVLALLDEQRRDGGPEDGEIDDLTFDRASKSRTGQAPRPKPKLRVMPNPRRE